MRRRILLLSSLLFVVFFACKKDEGEDPIPSPEDPDTGVVFNLNEVPYANLSDYRFFVGDINQFTPNERVLPYEVITPLFSDYAHKKRFIWMPSGVKATYAGDGTILDFPEGTVMIKNFYYDNVQPNNTTRLMETRLIYRKDGEWKFADYIWNEAQTEAVYNMNGGNVPIEWIDDNGELKSVNYRIPAELECYTCHKTVSVATPIGPKPQNLNNDYPYSTGSMNQLDKWIEMGFLENSLPENIVTVVDWTDESQSLHERVRAYVDMNCSHCHRSGSHCDYRPIRLAYSETGDDLNLGICVEPDEDITDQLTHIIARGNPNRSVMFYRMNTTEEQYRMPLLGRTLIHQEAIDLFEEYITSLTPNCP